jgi:Tol biopolymer transport system component
MNSDGIGNTKIPLPGGGLITRLDPALSPDGARIAFARGPRSNSVSVGVSGEAASDIFTMNLDSSGIVRLTQGGGNRQPAWSHDRSRIAFTHTVNNALG